MFRALFQEREKLIVKRQDRHAAGRKTGENFCFGLRDFFNRLKKFQMRCRNGGDDGGMGANQGSQRCDLAGMVHADFKNPEIRAHGKPRQGQRHAPMIVKTFIRRMNNARSAKHGAQNFLGTGFASTARDTNAFAEIAHARRDGEIA